MTGGKPGTLARELARAFRAMLVSAAVMVGVAGGGLGWYLLVNNPGTSRDAAVVHSIENAHAAMIDEETGLRAYVVTGDRTFLAPYDEAQPALARANAAIEHTAARTRLARETIDFEVAQELWTADWARRAIDPATRVALLSPSGQLSTPKLQAFFAAGKQDFDSYRRTEAQLLDAAEGELTRSRHEAGVVLTGTFGALVVGAFVSVVAAIHRRRRLSARVVGPVAELLDVVHAVSRGELFGPPTVDGPAEIQSLRDGMADMVSSLSLQQRDLATRAEESAAVATRLRQVLGFARAVSSSLTLRYVLETVAASTRSITGAPRVRVWLVDEDGGTITLGYDTAVDRKQPTPDLVHPIGIGAVGRAARYGELGYSVDDDEQVGPAAIDAAIVAQPLIVGARVVGVIEGVVPDGEGRLADTSAEILETVAGHAATAIEAARLHQRTEQLSVVDALTGLSNRRRLDQDIELECERAMRYGRPLSFIMLDVDHFKSVNDTHGHARGDAVLQELGAALREQMRTCDSAYRYGGEEFAVLARETDAAGAAVMAERLRESIERRFARHGSGGITVSLGVASLPVNATSPEVLIHAADTALYDAKRGGRNRAVVAVDADHRSGATITS